jgi:hypothetical protein
MLPIIRTLYKLGPITVKEVSGPWIRDNIEPDFTNFGHGYRFSFIPKDELWLDKERVPDERSYFVTNGLEQIRQMQNGAPYEKALAAGDKKEARERHKGNPTKGLKMGDVVLQDLGEFKGCRVKLVNGKKVRDVDENFTEGGHDLVYDYIKRISGPKTIWIDNDLTPMEIPPTLEHEGDERGSQEKGMSYPKAHEHALQVEWAFRHKRS